jgi:hypothetical protein
MVINNTTTQISFFPLISFGDITSVRLEVLHKNTRTKITATTTPIKIGTKVSLNLPSLTNINAVANNLDVILFRVFDGNVLVWEYLSTWSNESTNNYNVFKPFTATATQTPEFITL